MERQAAVAGTFYPADPERLRSDVSAALAADAPQSPVPEVRGVVVPHAGHVYSGRTAGRVWARAGRPERVLLLGPNHTGRGASGAVWTEGAWQTPLGAVAMDTRLAAALVDAHPYLTPDTEAHLTEHALEVQLPFLQVLAPGVQVVPVALGDPGLNLLEEVARAVAAVLGAFPGVLVAVSTDMSHYISRQEAQARDRLALEPMQRLDAPGLYTTVREHGISMCGVVPATVGLAALARLGATRAELVDYTCSGDVTGDDDQVVAYAGLTVT